MAGEHAKLKPQMVRFCFLGRPEMTDVKNTFATVETPAKQHPGSWMLMCSSAYPWASHTLDTYKHVFFLHIFVFKNVFSVPWYIDIYLLTWRKLWLNAWSLNICNCHKDWKSLFSTCCDTAGLIMCYFFLKSIMMIHKVVAGQINSHYPLSIHNHPLLPLLWEFALLSDHHTYFFLGFQFGFKSPCMKADQMSEWFRLKCVIERLYERDWLMGGLSISWHLIPCCVTQKPLCLSILKAQTNQFNMIVEV